MQHSFLRKIYLFYADGLRSMTVGRTLWKIIFIKLLVLFAVIKYFFFPDYLETHFATDTERSEHVLAELTQVINTNSL